MDLGIFKNLDFSALCLTGRSIFLNCEQTLPECGQHFFHSFAAVPNIYFWTITLFLWKLFTQTYDRPPIRRLNTILSPKCTLNNCVDSLLPYCITQKASCWAVFIFTLPTKIKVRLGYMIKALLATKCANNWNFRATFNQELSSFLSLQSSWFSKFYYSFWIILNFPLPWKRSGFLYCTEVVHSLPK